MIDMVTALLFLGFANIIFALMLWLTTKQLASERTISLLTWAKLALGMAFMLLAGRGSIPDILSKNLGNTLLITGCALECIGAWIFTGRSRWKTVLPPVLLISLLAMNGGIMAGFSGGELVAVASFAVAVLMILCSMAFLPGDSSKSYLTLTIGVTDAVAGLINIIRGAIALSLPEFSLLLPNPVQYWAVGSFFIFVFTNGFGLLLLIKEESDKQLRESEDRYRDLVENSRDLICTHDLHGNILSVNPQPAQLLGYTRAELLAMNIRDILVPEMCHEFPKYLDEIRSKHAAHGLMFIKTKEGEKRIWEYSNTLRSEGVSEPIVRGMAHDVTERRRAEDALRRSEEKYRLLAEQSLQGIAILKGMPPVFVYVNPKWTEIFGYTADEVFSLGPDAMWDLVHPDDRSMVRRRNRDRLSGKQVVPRYEFRIVRKDKTVRWVEVFAGLIESGPEPVSQAVYVDVTDRKLNEEMLRQLNESLERRVEERTAELNKTNAALMESEKQLRILSSRLLEAQEEERKRIAHELHDSIGGTLSAIKFGLENVLGKMHEGEAAAEALQTLVATTQHAMEEARRIYMDLRPSILDDLGLLAAIGWFTRHFGTIYPAIHIEKSILIREEDIPKDLKIIIFRVIQEALHNVAKHSEANRIDLSLVRSGSSMELAIADNGIGFRMEDFKDGSSTAGLGLSSMQERVESSSGFFSIQSVKGEGTRIRASWKQVE